MNGYWIFEENKEQNKSSYYEWGIEVHQNEIGYRADSIYSDGFKVMSLGCSMTYGYGLCDNETWPKLLTDRIPNCVNLNFGVTGCSNDRIVRNLIKYYDFIKPDLVIIMWTSVVRREYFTDIVNNYTFEDCYRQPYGKYDFVPQYISENKTEQDIFKLLIELSNKQEDSTNWYKNYLLANYFLRLKNAKWIFLDAYFDTPNRLSSINDTNYIDLPYDLLDFARDGAHPGPKSAKHFSDKLFQSIIDKFPNYLPKKLIKI